MSGISTFYDTLVTTLDTLFGSTHTRIPRPRDLAANNEMFLRTAYGLVVEDATRVDGEFKNFVIERSFTVRFTREIVETESDFSVRDTKVKELLEDVFTFQKDMYNVDRLGIPSTIRILDLAPSSGVEDFVTDNKHFVTMSATITVEIDEVL